MDPNRPLPRSVLRVFEERRREEQERLRLYGHVRPIIHATFHSQEVVAVGNTLHFSGEWNTFFDFLEYYIKKRLNDFYGQAWGRAELQKEIGKRHPILRWYDGLCRLQQGVVPDEAGIYQVELDGPSAAYVQLAYDLYILDDNRKLQEEVLRRLKDINSFHGARYELTVAATMIRAGFDVAYEDESDNRKKHPEFVAIDKTTKETVAVEAKARRRPGLMGWLGPKDPPDTVRLSLDPLLRNAIAKAPELPYVIFIDVNMAPEDVGQPEPAWVADARAMVQRLGHGYDSFGIFTGVPFTALVLTNHPHDYAENGEPDPKKLAFTTWPNRPKHPFRHPATLDRIEFACKQYGNIPSEFPRSSG